MVKKNGIEKRSKDGLFLSEFALQISSIPKNSQNNVFKNRQKAQSLHEHSSVRSSTNVCIYKYSFLFVSLQVIERNKTATGKSSALIKLV